VGGKVLCLGGVSKAFFSRVGSNLFALTVDINQRAGVDNLCLFSDILKRYRVVSIVSTQQDAVIDGNRQFSLVTFLERLVCKWLEQVLLFSKKPFLAAHWLPLHTGLIMLAYLLHNGSV